MPSPVLVAEALSQSYGEKPLLAGVDLAIEDQERMGLVGDNGSGKSTLAKILAGLIRPDGGRLSVRRGARVAYLDQAPVFEGTTSARALVREGLENWIEAHRAYEALMNAIAEGLVPEAELGERQVELEHRIEREGGWERGHEVEAALLGLGVRDIDAPVASRSGGELRRIALARLLVSSPDLAILDEPTNHLDADAVEWLERTLRERFRGAVLLVTHDRWLLDRVANRTLELERGELHSYSGGWDSFLEGKAARLDRERRVEENRQNFLRTELEWLRRSPAARTTKQRARVERAEAAIAAKPQSETRALELTLDTTRHGKTLVDARSVSVVRGGRTLVRGLDLCLRKAERIALVGPNGAGKTSLLRVLLGEEPPDAGEVVRGPHTAFAYLDQNRSGLEDERTLEENVCGGARRIEVAGKTVDSRSYLSRFGFPPEAQRKRVGSLSGGERARVALAKLLLAPANVLVLDEPTNDLDVSTLAAVESMILDGERTALLVSHDRYFLDRVATAVLALDGEGGATLVQGGYQHYLAYLERRREDAAKERSARAEVAPPTSPHKRSAGPATATTEATPGTPKRLTYAERLELDALPGRIAELEAELEQLDARALEPGTFETATSTRAFTEERERAQAALDAAMTRWLELEERRA